MLEKMKEKSCSRACIGGVIMGKITGFKEFKREVSEKRPVKERIKDFKEVYINVR